MLDWFREDVATLKVAIWYSASPDLSLTLWQLHLHSLACSLTSSITVTQHVKLSLGWMLLLTSLHSLLLISGPNSVSAAPPLLHFFSSPSDPLATSHFVLMPFTDTSHPLCPLKNTAEPVHVKEAAGKNRIRAYLVCAAADVQELV